MTYFVEAIYEDGVFRPLQPVQLPEHKQVSLVITDAGRPANGSTAATSDVDVRRQREALAALRTKIDALPSCAPDDGLGGADHDRILYGR